MWCQRARTSKPIVSKETLGFHPYFDDFDDAMWLVAEVEQSTPAVFKFRVLQPTIWSDLKFERAKWHFKDFDLQELLATNSANQLTGIRSRLNNLLDPAPQTVSERIWWRRSALGEIQTSTLGRPPFTRQPHQAPGFAAAAFQGHD